MENDQLSNTWKDQNIESTPNLAIDIIKSAKKQRNRQYGAITIMTLTVVVLITYVLYIGPSQWDNFTLGLVLMIGSLVVRILIEIGSVYHKERQLISLDNKSYRSYLKRFYKKRLMINYFITPICIVLYCYGFYLLLPYFKREFSEGFYRYIKISGIASLLFIVGIIINSIRKENSFLNKMKKE